MTAFCGCWMCFSLTKPAKRAKGHAERALSDLRNLMETLGLTIEQAMAVLIVSTLALMEDTFSQYRSGSVQEFRFAISGQIRRQIFYVNLMQRIETHIKSKAIIKALKQLRWGDAA